MRPSGAADDPVEVEIVEVHDQVRARRSRPGTAEIDGPDGGPSRRRALTWVGAGVVAGLAIAVVGVNVADARRQAELLTALAGVPGVLAPLDGPPEEAWRVPGGRLLAATDRAVVFDVTGEQSLRAVEPSTGDLVWSRELADREDCVPVGEAGPGTGRQGPALVACSPFVDPAAVLGGVGATPSRVVALDIATGAEVRSFDLDAQPMTVDVVDDDLVISWIGERATVRAARWDPAADRVVWTYRSEPGRAEAIQSDGWWMSVPDVGAIWYGHERYLAVSPETGREVPGDDPPVLGSAGERMSLPDGGSVEWEHDVGGRSLGSRVLDGDGGLRFEFAGEPWVAAVTDGSRPRVLAMRRAVTAEVVGLDARTGEQLWSARTMQGLHPYLQIDGVVISVGTLRAVALDLTDGTRLWEQSLGRPRMWPLTDGRVVLLLTREGGELVMTAHELRTGARVWRVPVPQDAFYLEQAGDDIVLVHTEMDVVAFRRAPTG